jgi:hypothetical protein
MTNMDNAQEVFAAKVDAFAATLELEEQAMLVDLLVGDDEVTGFSAGWPGFGTLLGVSTTAGGNPEGVFVPGRI